MKNDQLSLKVSRYILISDNNISKVMKVLIAFVSNWKGHRFNAERQLHDHCLHSTVSWIEKKYRINIQRKWVCVKGYRGVSTRVKVYWMSDEDKEKFVIVVEKNGEERDEK